MLEHDSNDAHHVVNNRAAVGENRGQKIFGLDTLNEHCLHTEPQRQDAQRVSIRLDPTKRQTREQQENA
jgi:hypothetical protein